MCVHTCVRAGGWFRRGARECAAVGACVRGVSARERAAARGAAGLAVSRGEAGRWPAGEPRRSAGRGGRRPRRRSGANGRQPPRRGSPGVRGREGARPAGEAPASRAGSRGAVTWRGAGPNGGGGGGGGRGRRRLGGDAGVGGGGGCGGGGGGGAGLLEAERRGGARGRRHRPREVRWARGRCHRRPGAGAAALPGEQAAGQTAGRSALRSRAGRLSPRGGRSGPRSRPGPSSGRGRRRVGRPRAGRGAAGGPPRVGSPQGAVGRRWPTPGLRAALAAV